MKQVDDDTREILESFIAEAFERLDDAETALSKAGCEADSACLGTVFRLFHSVKGSAAFLELNAVRELTHEAETLLEVHSKGGVPVTPESLDVIYQTIDLLRELVRKVQTDFSDEGCDEQVSSQIGVIRDCIGTLKAGPAAPAAPAASATPDAAAAPSAPATPAAVSAPPGAAPEGDASGSAPAGAGDTGSRPNRIILNELVTRDMTERFLAESADLVDRIESDALGLLSSPNPVDDVHAMFRAVHTVKGNAGFFGYELDRKSVG